MGRQRDPRRRPGSGRQDDPVDGPDTGNHLPLQDPGDQFRRQQMVRPHHRLRHRPRSGAATGRVHGSRRRHPDGSHGRGRTPRLRGERLAQPNALLRHHRPQRERRRLVGEPRRPRGETARGLFAGANRAHSGHPLSLSPQGDQRRRLRLLERGDLRDHGDALRNRCGLHLRGPIGGRPKRKRDLRGRREDGDPGYTRREFPARIGHMVRRLRLHGAGQRRQRHRLARRIGPRPKHVERSRVTQVEGRRTHPERPTGGRLQGRRPHVDELQFPGQQ